MTPQIPYCARCILIRFNPTAGWSQPTEGDTARSHAAAASNVLYVNPVHLANGNITLSYERFTAPHKSFKVLLSGGVKTNYVAAGVDLNYYPAPPAKINYFLGGSFLMQESPIATGVPISQPWNRFSEGSDDRYFVGLEVKNGGVFRIREFLDFEIDLGVGPAFNLTQRTWLAVWGISVNLGIPF